MKMFDANMAADVSTWLGTTTITTSGEIIPAEGEPTVMSWIIAIQATLADMQTTLTTLAGEPTVGSTPVVEDQIVPVVDTTTK